MQLFERGYRPFFLGASLFAGVAIPAWALMLLYGWTPPGPLQGQQWHVHEMIFGFVPAVIAGFLLTAIPNWTGRPPIAGAPLMALFALWLAGRFDMAFLGTAPVVAAMMDAAFLLVLTAVITREIIAAKNTRNLPVVAMVALLAIANAGFHYGLLSGGHPALFVRLGLSAIAGYLLLIGGRVAPAFTTNWMKQNGIDKLPAPDGLADRVGIIAPAIALSAWTVLGEHVFAGGLMGVAGVAVFVRVYRWHGWLTLKEPIVTIMHLGYLWIAIWFGLMSLAMLTNALSTSSALHGLTTGAIGAMTLAIMSRASLGHSGQPITASLLLKLAYLLVTIGAILRILAANLPGDYVSLVGISGLIWAAAYLMFAIEFAPLFFRARKPS